MELIEQIVSDIRKKIKKKYPKLYLNKVMPFSGGCKFQISTNPDFSEGIIGSIFMYMAYETIIRLHCNHVYNEKGVKNQSIYGYIDLADPDSMDFITKKSFEFVEAILKAEKCL